MIETPVRCVYDDLVDISDLRPHPKNRNKHPEAQIQRLAEILQYQGFRIPIRVSKLSGFVTGGHGRIAAAKLNGWETVPVNYQEYLSEEQEYSDLVADNSIALWAELDLKGIGEDVLPFGPDFDIDLLGLEDFTIDPSEQYDGDPDAVPETPKEAKTKRGELWLLGTHRVLCGDATDKADVERLMAGENAEFCFTSPPYSDQRDYGGNLVLEPKHLAKFLSAPCEIFAVNLGMKRQDHEVVAYWDDYISAAKDMGLKLLSWNVWDRGEAGSIASQTAMFAIAHEWIFVFGRQKKDLNLTVPNKNAGHFANHTSIRQKDGTTKKRDDKIVRPFSNMRTVINLSCEKARNHGFDHPAMFPVALPEEYVKACCSTNDAVFEPFTGSGSTLIACEKTQRRCFGMEIEPLYIDVILERWAKFTGKDPVREDGMKWSDLNG